MTSRRRYEILLPATFNDGRDVMATCMTCLSRTLGQVLDRFGAFTYTPQAVQGAWTDGGTRYDDQLHKLTLDVEDTDGSHRFVDDLKQELLARYDQIEIYVTSHVIDVH
jgi:hypothetical protein